MSPLARRSGFGRRRMIRTINPFSAETKHKTKRNEQNISRVETDHGLLLTQDVAEVLDSSLFGH
jgi:hypothetical protein